MTLLVSAAPTCINGVAVNPSVWRSASEQPQPNQRKATTPGVTEPINEVPVEESDRGDGYLGQSIVYNNCTFTVHSNIPQEMLSHPFAHDPRLGVSWKLWRTDVENTSPVQFEWTWHDALQRTWYDLSMINAGNAGWLSPVAHRGEPIVGDEDGLGAYVGKVAIKHAFKVEGMTLVPEVVGGNCVPLHCASGEAYCTASYNVHNDWGQQHD
ncbi:hypothetical protein AYO20_05046 [Fonsecaea nubica]|uniref:Uncharacterized protein n=1 Tax=Fonsecaea nubica TaxID=856822 RepID=A0A178D3K3_9EURO|nr:hypothetical protein AYO20_05046 [Fonsecaea nubica]OAL35665.1 hypothetical protein AYO20_05046 [Fonsecaea nubica]